MRTPDSNTLTSGQLVRLPQNQTLDLSPGELRVLCLSGTIWITWAGAREKCLTQGDSLIVDSHINICIQAFSPSTLRLARPQQKVLGMGLPQIGCAGSGGSVGSVGRARLEGWAIRFRRFRDRVSAFLDTVMLPRPQNR